MLYQHLLLHMASRESVKNALTQAEEAAEKEARAAEEARMMAELQDRRRKRQRTQESERQVVEKVLAFNPNAGASVRVGLDP